MLAPSIVSLCLSYIFAQAKYDKGILFTDNLLYIKKKRDELNLLFAKSCICVLRDWVDLANCLVSSSIL